MVVELNDGNILELMPELGGLKLTVDELKGGITNKLYRVQSSDGHDLVVRLYGRKTELFIDREVEMENIRRMESTGVTPKLFKYLPDRRVTVVEFIPGYVLKNEDFLREELWEKIVRPIKIIHQSGVTLPYHFNPLGEVKRMYQILSGINPDYPEFKIEQTIEILEGIDDHAKIAPDQYVACHNDLLADNFILVEDKEKYGEPMYLIDWEYAGMSTPYYDIGDMFQEILVPRETETGILRVYWGEKDLDHHIYMTDLFKPFPDIYWFLWSLIQHNISTIDFDFYTYGKVKYENARGNIQYLDDHYGVRFV
ncbi:MAG: phosphotransferase [Proteobacteria bacterium]|nr:phosphotransferase [Pseudomonadota bacterium]